LFYIASILLFFWCFLYSPFSLHELPISVFVSTCSAYSSHFLITSDLFDLITFFHIFHKRHDFSEKCC
jgi:multisubunit Na+/H+ antiporter MnhE subunit